MENIWKKDTDIEEINRFSQDSMAGNLGISITEKGADFLTATMPVGPKTIQPLGILHGGASVVLAETLGSVASYLTLDDNHFSVGLEIKANHIKSVSKGIVTGRVTPVHLGKTTQIWDISIENGQNALICTSRLTMMIIKGQM